MRKFIAGILIVIMCAQMCVFASDLPFFDKDYTSYEETVTYSATLNKDIKIDLDGENSVFKGIENFVDIDALIKSVFDSTSTLTGKMNVSPDYRKGKIYAGGKTVVPLKINKNLSVTSDANTDVWMEYDFTDAANPTFKMVQNNPVYNKFVVYDIYDLLKEEGGEYADVFTAVMAKIMSKETMDAYKKAYVDLLVKYADIKRSGRNYTIAIDDAALKSIIKESVTNLTSYLKTFLVNGNYVSPEEFDEAYNEAAPVIYKALETMQEIKILGDGGIVLKVTTDSRDYISEAEMTAHLCINVYEIMEKCGVDVSAYNKDNGIIDVTFKIKTTVTKAGADVKIDLPVLTKENSFSIADLYNAYPDYPAEKNECYHYDWGYVYHQGLPIIIDGKFYPHLRDIAESVGFAKCDIVYENGNITLMRPDWVNCGNYKTATFKVGDNTVYLDGNAYNVSLPAIEIDNSVVISDEIAKILFRAEHFGYDVGVDFVEKSYRFGFDYKICDHKTDGE